MLTMDRLDALVRENHKAHLARIKPETITAEPKEVPAVGASEGPGQSEEVRSPDGGSQPGTSSGGAGDVPPAKGVGRVLLFFNGLQKNHEEFGRLRHNRDRLCLLHLVVIGFINEFGIRGNDTRTTMYSVPSMRSSTSRCVKGLPTPSQGSD